MIIDPFLLTVCGRYCGNCIWYFDKKESTCPGCSVHEGHPAWGECEIYSCVNKHQIDHCGLCDEFPCDLLVNYFNHDNPEGSRNAAIRVAINAYRMKHGDRKTLEYLEKVGTLNKPVK